MTWRTQKQYNFVRDNFEDMSTKEIAERLNLTDTQVRSMYRLLKLRRSESSKFKKGSVPWNKGKSYPTHPNARIRQFKNGHLPHNTKHDGAIVIRTDNRGRKMKHVRVALSKWEYLHRKIWKDVHGDIPKGHCVVFKNGNEMDCRLENLECVSRSELLQRNRGAIDYRAAGLKAWETRQRKMFTNAV